MTGSIADKWKMVRLGDVSKLISGRDLVPEQYNDQNNGIPYITGASNIDDGCVIINRWTTEPVVISNPDDILITCKGTVGLTAFNNFGICHLARQIMAIRADTNIVDKKYLKYAVDGSFLKLLRKARSMIPGVSREDILSLTLPLPPLDEQKRIADVLDKASELITKRKEQIRLMDELAKSLFIEMFGDPVENPMGWDIVNIEDMCSEIVDCPHSTPIHSDVPTNYPSIRTSELQHGYINWASMKYVDENEYLKRITRIKPEKNDIIYGREGSYGDAVILPDGYSFCLGQRVMLLRRDKKKCHYIFLWAMLCSDYVYNQAKEKNVGATVGHVNVGDIKKFTILSPPLPLQKEFADRIDAIEQQKALLQNGLAKMETAYKALMQEYFG